MLLKHVCETIQMALFCHKKRNLTKKLQHDYILLTENLKMVFMFICERKKDCLLPLIPVLIGLNGLQV